MRRPSTRPGQVPSALSPVSSCAESLARCPPAQTEHAPPAPRPPAPAEQVAEHDRGVISGRGWGWDSGTSCSHLQSGYGCGSRLCPGWPHPRSQHGANRTSATLMKSRNVSGGGCDGIDQDPSRAARFCISCIRHSGRNTAACSLCVPPFGPAPPLAGQVAVPQM